MIKIPNHLAVIPDGNRRWAKENGLKILKGHIKGLDNFKKIGEYVFKKGVNIITFYCFSSENWNRPKKEVNYLMRLFERCFSKKEIENYNKKGIRIKVIGRKERLPLSLQNKINSAENLTKGNKEKMLNLAVSYSGREEIVNAVKKIIKDRMPFNKINEDLINKNLWTEGISFPDLIIRTGREQRISNFLIWQSAYSELHFSDKYWPEFSSNDIDKAFDDFSNRVRRFGR
ncbi:MAG: polyprenyl diphosphate synthase [Candidatus Pacebacteria bacterium]|nr:polyprenyl diphosphate synthase [Candidatus Paceibacterota bacterium]